ncbi:MAG: hypothetical protein EA424_18340 [Planctomycetaceae bacterium]|nr:MAG: hypothetical protein EA424_18340 [Planctomycetaceae bacterium]
MTIVASQDLGDQGQKESSPVVVQWRWYHHVPSLGLWAVLVALLFLVPANRCAQAWLIVLPVLAVQLGWSMFARLLSLPVGVAENAGGVLVALAVSWAAVWLVAPWLTQRLIPVGLALALLLMWGVGGVYSFSAYDMASLNQAGVSILAVLLGSAVLLSSTVLTATCCRRSARPERFLPWALWWTVVVTLMLVALLATVLMIGPFIIMGLLDGNGAWDVVSVVLGMMIGLLIWGGVLGVAIYLVNLPFLLLARQSPLFRARRDDTLRPVSVPEDAGPDAQSVDDAVVADPDSPAMVKEL